MVADSFKHDRMIFTSLHNASTQSCIPCGGIIDNLLFTAQLWLWQGWNMNLKVDIYLINFSSWPLACDSELSEFATRWHTSYRQTSIFVVFLLQHRINKKILPKAALVNRYEWLYKNLKIKNYECIMLESECIPQKLRQQDHKA